MGNSCNECFVIRYRDEDYKKGGGVERKKSRRPNNIPKQNAIIINIICKHFYKVWKKFNEIQ